jgi:choline dehydrogenase
LDRHRGDSRFEILGDTLVERCLFDGARCIGVATRIDSVVENIYADVVVLAAGVYGSPSVMLRSGLGGTPTLNALGVAVVSNLPGVGRFLQDHPAVSIPITIEQGMRSRLAAFYDRNWVPGELAVARLGSRYNVEGSFDLQAAPLVDTDKNSTPFAFGEIEIMAMSPSSTGSLTLTSRDPDILGHVDHGYLLNEDDRQSLVDGIEQARALLCETTLATVVREEGKSRSRTAEQLVESIPSNVHCYHSVGTCRMGPNPTTGAVVDGTGSVFGVQNLYVADASIMPRIPRAHTNLPAVVVGLRVADMVAGQFYE